MEDFWVQYGDEMLPVIGDFPRKGSYLPSFMLVDDQKRDAALESFAHTPKLIVTLLSVDEDEHAGILLLRETRRFLDSWPHLKLIVITVDSPSSLARARHEHGLPNIALLSTLRGRDFHKRYGVLITEFPLSGYTSPSIILADAANVVHYSERLANTRDFFDFDAIEALLQEGEQQAIEAEREAEESRQQQLAEREKGTERLLEKAKLIQDQLDKDGNPGR
ncbi:thiol peroxidase [Chromobacterium phragmitis]|uniref:Redoxin family protein n=1 Tax=Chromobacterium phragmitis TaxID=2202141 RepID=A0A344UGP3_9NEIS|nr:redoxin family protein [Chromobacterium phragmitis]AXE29082.1 thiol peroxidase [Chromobacterium phragmitis]AXE34441.1 thiol peroxidase [Chromobacterium phragmitis]